jgi:hypothetical protein
VTELGVLTPDVEEGLRTAGTPGSRPKGQVGRTGVLSGPVGGACIGARTRPEVCDQTLPFSAATCTPTSRLTALRSEGTPRHPMTSFHGPLGVSE